MLFPIFLVAIILRHNNLSVSTVPIAAPIFVSPTEAERYINFFIIEHLLNRLFKKLFSTFKPIMIIAKTENPVFFGKLCLLFHYRYIGKVVIIFI